jgi:hypothetical protein
MRGDRLDYLLEFLDRNFYDILQGLLVVIVFVVFYIMW